MKPHINIFWMIAGVFFVLMLIAGFWKIYKDRKKKQTNLAGDKWISQRNIKIKEYP